MALQINSFNEAYYLQNNQDVALAIANGYLASAWQHYDLWGRSEGRAGSIADAFDADFYLSHNADVAQAVAAGLLTAQQHYDLYGKAEGRAPNETSYPPAAEPTAELYSLNSFNESYYVDQNPDVRAALSAGTLASALEHYQTWGEAEGRMPNPGFDPDFYTTRYTDVATGIANGSIVGALYHFENDGLAEGRQPSVLGFDETWYLGSNPDVAAAVARGAFVSGWEHFALFGAQEGRSPVQDVVGEVTFTLQDPVLLNPGEDGVPDVTAIYWGYTPNGADDVTDGHGIPVADLLSFLTTITGLDLFELGLIDADGQDPLQNLQKIELEFGDGTIDLADATTVNIVLNGGIAAAFSINAEAVLGAQYFNFLNNLLFDRDGNSRLYEKVIVEGVEEIKPFMEAQPYIVLTTKENNGGTIEVGNTTDGDDTIVAGRLELLHQAYIDGGAGYNTLEVDAKGLYAQPLELLNIQEVRVENLPNVYSAEKTVYTYTDTNGEVVTSDFLPQGWTDARQQADANYAEHTVQYSTYPDRVVDLGVDHGNLDSVLDLSRATSLELLVVTENEDTGTDVGELTVVGIRNGATARFEGGFSEMVTLHYGEGQTGELNIELAIGDIDTGFNLIHNAAVLNVDSQGVENHMHSFNAGNGSLSRMNISGTGAFGVEEDLGVSFNADRPAIIDASANTGGVDLRLSSGPQNVVFTGTSANDTFLVSTAEENTSVTTPPAQPGGEPITTDPFFSHNNDESVVIVGGEGNDHFVVGTYSATITNGNGDSNFEVSAAVAEITAGNGANDFELEVSGLNLTTGNGDNTIELVTYNWESSTNPEGSADVVSNVSILAGSGHNVIDVVQATESVAGDPPVVSFIYEGTIDITVGDGGNDIDVIGARSITITSGAGDDVIRVAGDIISIATNGGNDTVTVIGYDDDYVPAEDGAVLKINTGTGSATINLGSTDLSGGTNDFFGNGSITAMEGSVISGSNVTFFVNVSSDLRAADLTGLTGVTKVILDDDSTGFAGQGGDTNDAMLTLTADQFAAIGADAFSVQGSTFGADADIQLVVTENTTLGDLVDLTALNKAINLHLIINDGVTLTLTAEELHKYVADIGVANGEVNNNDIAKGQVVITDAGLRFNPFSNGGLADTGTLSADFGTLLDSKNLTVIRTLDGYERPLDAAGADLMTLDSDVTPTVGAIGDADTLLKKLVIVGDADITFTGAANLGDNFTVDFSALNGAINDFTLAQAEDITTGTNRAKWGEIIGNGDARVNLQITDGATVGGAGITNGGIHTSGVSTLVITGINVADNPATVDINEGDGDLLPQASASTATLYVCDSTQGIETLGLQNNRYAVVNFEQVNWGTTILLEGDGYANGSDQEKNLGNPDLSEIGFVNANFFEAGANAVVNINNQGVALGLNQDGEERVLAAAGIDVTNAKRLTLNITDGDAVIRSVDGDSVTAFVVNGVEDVTVGFGANVFLEGKITVINATGVAGDFVIDMSGSNDFSKTALSGIDGINIVDNGTAAVDVIALTLSADQVVTLGSLITDGTDVDTSTLNVTELGIQPLDLSVIDVDNIGTVVFTDTGTLILVDPATNFGGADSVKILAKASATTVEMTADQFETIAGTLANDDAPVVLVEELGTRKAILVLTDLPNDATLDLGNVAAAADVVLRIQGVVATEDLKIEGGANLASVTLEVSGVNDLTKGDLAGATIDKVAFTADATLTLTAAQLAAIPFTDVNGDGKADAWTVATGAVVKLNITDVANGCNLDLSLLEKAGVDIGTLTLLDSNGPITLGAGANLGGADSIVTPTKDLNDPVDGIEPTTLALTAAQFDQLAGTGTITGDGTVNITALLNNKDVDGAIPLTPDVAVIDVSGIAATVTKGTVTLGQATVTLDATSNLAGFRIDLGTGQMIRFATATQADGAEVVETGVSPTAIAWLFTTPPAAPIDTSKYDGDIDTLFISEDLVDGQNEENLWTTLAESIVVEKVGGEIPDVLIGFDRVNTFEALTSIAGVTYDDLAEFQTVERLTINLEGNTNIGNVVIGDTVTNGENIFKTLTINSYEDRSTLDDPATLGNEDTGFAFQPNKVGNIGLTTGTPGTLDELLNVRLNTFVRDGVTNGNGFNDAINVNGPAVERDGLALQVGTITFAGNTPAVGDPALKAQLTLTGAEAISIAAVNISDADVSLLDINASAFTGKLTIGGIVPTGGATPGLNVADASIYDHIYVVDGYTAVVGDTIGTAGEDLLVVTGGDNDFTQATAFTIDKVHFTANGTLTLTAAQVAAIGTSDGADLDKSADAWSALAGLNVTLNIIDLNTEELFLDKVAAAGITIGSIKIKDTDGIVTLDPDTTLGNAASIEVPAGTTLNLTALQFDQLAGTGTITGLTATGEVKGTVNITNLVNTLDSADDLDTDADDYTLIDVTLVSAKQGTITLGAADVSLGDLTATLHSNLGQFSITLNDIDSTGLANELAGQTIRFSTAAQAERAIIVQGVDAAAPYVAGDPERDTNVVWLFDTITGTATAGKINTHDYDAGLGRVWVNDVLVNGKNVEDIFSSPSAIQANPTTGLINLNSSTIIRVVNTGDLTQLLPEDLSVSRTLEVESFTALAAGLIFSNPDKLVDVENLTLDLGGAVTIGAISIDDIVAAQIRNDNHFGTLTINSKLAGPVVDNYLLPENFDPQINAYPTAVNTLGAISSGATRSELANVTINTFLAGQGVGLNTGTITFVETTNLITNPSLNSLATLTLTGNKNVNIQSVDTSDVDITALTVNTLGYSGVLTAPGTSPALLLDNTQTLTFVNDGGAPEFPWVDPDGAGPLPPVANPGGSDGVITLGNATNAGVAGNELSFINAAGYDGNLNLGVIAQIDGTNDDLNGDGDFLDVGENRAFTLTTGQGITTATLAAANSRTPTLKDGSEWLFNYTGAAVGSSLRITPSAVFETGGTLKLTNVPLIIEGGVNLSNLVDKAATTTVTEGLFITGGSIEVLAGATLTLTAHQVDALRVGGVDIVGAGSLHVTGDASNLALGANIKTLDVDISAVTLIATPAAGFDVDATVSLTLPGATVGLNTGLAQTVLGSANADAITTVNGVNNTITGGAGNDTLTGGTGGATGGNTYRVDAGTDTLVGLSTGDVVNVSAGATANAALGVAAATAGNFTATAATVNNGTAVLTDADVSLDSSINVSAATGANGFTLTGGTGNAQGADLLIGSSKADILNGGNNNQTAAAAKDTLTGNAGADVFAFNVQTSTPVTLTDTTTTPNIDRENIQVATEPTANGTLIVHYTLNGVAPGSDVTVNLLDADTAAVASGKIALAMAAVPGFTAVNVGDTSAVQGPNGSSLTIDSAGGGTSGATTTLSNGTDQAQVDRINLGTGVITPTEKYAVAITLAGGATSTIFTYTAVAGDDAQDVAVGLALLIDPNGDLAATASAAGGVWGVNVTDSNPDNGGFTTVTTTTGGFDGSGASNIGATLLATADVITDFLSGTDKVDLNLVAGSATNYAEAAAATDYATALAAADLAMNNVVQYYLTSIPDDAGTAGVNEATGLLFFDANRDGNVDGVISLTGVDQASFAATDIIA